MDKYPFLISFTISRLSNSVKLLKLFILYLGKTTINGGTDMMNG